MCSVYGCVSRSEGVPSLFTLVRKTAESDCCLRHVCPSARNNSVATRRIFTKFDVRVFFENSLEEDVKSDITNMKITNWRDCIRNRPKWKEFVGKDKTSLKL